MTDHSHDESSTVADCGEQVPTFLRIDAIAEAFETAWRNAPPEPSIDDFLGAEGIERAGLLLKLVSLDLELRLARGESVRVESYLARYPELGQSPEQVVGLAAAEFQARADSGESVIVEDYREPFLPHTEEFPSELEQADAGRFAETTAEVLDNTVIEGTGETIGPYTLLQRLGEGGFGIVYVAERSQPVRQTVALKILKLGMDTEQVVARFESERQALAMMEHPHIAKVLDGGATESGRPYFVMELVKGEPITAYCDSHRMTLDHRLMLFVDVCHAIQHAHHKGVIHRDIKPSNVLTAEHDGQPVVKVIDFGIAKATEQKLADQTIYTALGQMIGTPAYMSPEQAEASGVDIDTRSDVYSLGVLLYELLTGTTPIEPRRIREANLADVQRMICDEDAQRPSMRLSSLGDKAAGVASHRGMDLRRMRQLLSTELDWIVVKALEKDRNRRYGTPDNFAEDVERYLRREAILARPPSAVYKLKKFTYRNRAAVLTTLGIAVALSVGTGVATWQAVVATRARAEAEEAQSETMDALRTATDDVVEKLIGSRESLGPNEREFLTSGIDRWQRFADRHGDSRFARTMRAEGAYNVASLQLKLGERRASLRNYRVSIEIFDRLVEQFPAVPAYNRALARSHIHLGHLLAELGDQDAARAAYGVGLAIYKKLVAEFPAVPAYQEELAASQINLGQLLAELGDQGAARAAYATALEVCTRLVEQFPGEPYHQHALATSHSSLGSLNYGLGDQEAARVSYEAALNIRKKLVEQFPDVREYKHALAASHSQLGNVLHRSGDKNAARTIYESGLEIYEKLAELFPAVPEYQQELAASHNNRAILLLELGDQGAARAAHEAALEVHKTLVEQFPSVPVHRQALATSHNNLANLLHELGDRNAARAAYEAALEIREKLVEQFPSVPAYQQDLAGCHNNLGMLLRDLGDQNAARAAYEAALANYKPLVEEFPAVPAYQQELAGSHYNLGVLLNSLGDSDAACAAIEAGRETQERLVERFPGVPEYQLALAKSHQSLAVLHWGLGEQDTALAAFEAAREIQMQLVEQFPAVPEYQIVLGKTNNNLGNLLSGLGNQVAARTAYEAARETQVKLVEQFPAVPEYQQELAGSHNNLGALLAALGDQGAARTAFDAALQIRKRLVEQFPAVPAYQVELGASYAKLGLVVRDDGKPGESLELFNMAVQILQAIHDQVPRDVGALVCLRNSHWARAAAYDRLERHAEAARDWSRALELSLPAEQRAFRLLRSLSQVKAGIVDEAVADVAELAKATNWTGEQWYNFVCVYSLASAKLPEKQQEYANRAIELLQKAVEAGYSDVDHLKTDPDLAPLRDREDFKKLVADLEAKR